MDREREKNAMMSLWEKQSKTDRQVDRERERKESNDEQRARRRRKMMPSREKQSKTEIQVDRER